MVEAWYWKLSTVSTGGSFVSTHHTHTILMTNASNCMISEICFILQTHFVTPRLPLVIRIVCSCCVDTNVPCLTFPVLPSTDSIDTLYIEDNMILRYVTGNVRHGSH